jgi:hypothetical protein
MSVQGQTRRVRSGDHLTQIGDIWYYLRVVPPDARDVFGKTKVKKSLGTSSHTEAKRLEKIEDVEFEEKLQRARHAGPDGLPREREARTEELVVRVYAELGDSDDPDRLEKLIAQVPARDREAVIDRIEQAEDAGMAAWEKVDQFWEAELRDQLFASALDADDWQAKRQEIVALIGDHQKQNVSEHTVDWAYVQWTKTASRPQQTLDEASRYLDDFKQSVNVRVLSGVRRAHLTDWRDELKNRGTPLATTLEQREARKLSNNSVNHRLEIVSAILRTGWREAPMAAPDISKIHLPVASNDRVAWPREELLKALGALEPYTGLAWVYVIALTTSTRIGELIAARKAWYKSNGFIEVPKEYTKMKKPHNVPIIELIREPLAKHLKALEDDDFMFDVPRPSNIKLKMSHETSKWFTRFYARHGIDQVTHELRDTWIDTARHSEKEFVKQELYEIVTGHSPKTASGGYGGERPAVLMKVNEAVCEDLLDDEMRAAILRLVA